MAYAAGFMKWFAEEAKRVYGDASLSLGRSSFCRHQATDWRLRGHHPLEVPGRDDCSEARTGIGRRYLSCQACAIDSFSALALAVWVNAQVFRGSFCVLTGSSRSIGAEMTGNPNVRKVTLTGSTEVGRTLMQQSANTVKKLSLELGGNAPFIVFDDADLDAAMAGAIASKYRNAGQTSVCVNPMYIRAGVYNEFAAKLPEAVNGLKVGNGLEPGVLQGPLIDQAAVAKVEEHTEDAISKGAHIVTGGKRHALGGTFFEATVLADMSVDAKVSTEETFGPLAPLFRFESDDDAVRLANDTEFGLASYFYSRDVGRIWRVAEALESGIVGTNTGLISTEVAPFGGVKQSGLGRKGSHCGMDEFLEVKYLCFGGLGSP